MAKKQSQPLVGDLKSLIDALSDPLWIVDGNGHLLWSNAAADGRKPNGKQVALEWRGGKASLIQSPNHDLTRRLEELEEREAHAQARSRRAEEREQWAEERVARAEERRNWAEERLAEEKNAREQDRKALEEQLAAARQEQKPAAPSVDHLKPLQDKLQRAEEQSRRIGQQLDETKERLKQAQQQLQEQEPLTRLAYFDERTQMPNRNHARRTLDKLLKTRTPVVLFSLDVDQFQRVRDRYGPAVGNELMRLLTRRLSEFVRSDDLLASSGLDCFFIVMPRPDATEIGLRESAGMQAERLLAEVNRPFTVHGQRVQVRASLGISNCPGDATTRDELLANAEAARLYAKEQGGGTYRVYDGEVKRRQERRSISEGQLRQAVTAREFTVHYQPIVDLKTARTAGAEALIRWQHRLDGMLLPAQFLDTADALGLLIPVGHLVIEDIITRLQQFPLPKSFFYSLNLSHRQFLDTALPDMLRPIPSDRLVIEMGSQADEDVDQAVRNLKPGTRVALDRFGAEPFTFDRLNGVQFVKLDRKLLRGVPEDKKATAVFLSALRLVQSLGLIPIAVGIENRVQVHFLRKHHCALGQGNFFSAPVDPSGLPPVLKEKQTWKF